MNRADKLYRLNDLLEPILKEFAPHLKEQGIFDLTLDAFTHDVADLLLVEDDPPEPAAQDAT